MTMNPIPPQAYTKDTMLKAYQWLQMQSDHIKQLASTPDILVSLYLKAQLNGDEFLERPSIQNFKSELRNLAGMINEFDSPSKEHRTRTSQPETPVNQTNHTAGTNQATSTYKPPHAQTVNQNEREIDLSQFAKIQPQTYSERASGGTGTSGITLDRRSLESIQEIKRKMNIDSDMEALRLLIAVGSKRLLDI